MAERRNTARSDRPSASPASGVSAPPLSAVGASPFSESVAGSTITSPSAADDANDTLYPLISRVVAESAIGADFDQVGDGGDSDVEGGVADVLNNGLQCRVIHGGGAVLVRHAEREENDEVDLVESDEEEDLMQNASAPVVPAGSESIEGWSPPGPSESHVPYAPKPNTSAPATFAQVDNPARWTDSVYLPKYKGNEYLGHFTPAGATVLPVDASGKRQVNGWEAYYQKYEANEVDKANYARGNATKDDMFPPERKGRLDVNVLKKHGCTADVVKNKPLFFLQCLFPIINPAYSPIEGDGRMPFFTHCAAWTNSYAAPRQTGYGHAYKNTDAAEMLKFMGVPIRHGALDGKPSTLYYRWAKDDDRYSSLIDDSISMTRFRELKSNFKLNNNDHVAGRGTDGYDPCNKYDYMCQSLTHNMNYFTEKADDDVTVDETTWGHGGENGECGGRLKNKPFPKGGQTVMLFDISRRYPRLYYHRHSLRKNERPAGFNQEGPSEIKAIIDMAKNLVDDRASDEDLTFEVKQPDGSSKKFRSKRIWRRNPHITADNHFSGDHVMDYAGGLGFGLTVTTRRDRIMKDIKKYCHVDKLAAGSTAVMARSRQMRYQNPITFAKRVPASETTKAYTKTHVSFQSTGATNISGVNNLPSCELFVTQKSRGRGENKRNWGIEQNEGRLLYLNSYFGVDNDDHMIKNANIGVISWKYWHSPWWHFFAMGAYDMYQECCDGGLDSAWAIPKKDRMSFSTFRQTLSEQMLTYDPRANEYLGDNAFRVSTQQPKRKRRKKSSSSVSSQGGGVSVESLKLAKSDRGRLCGDMEKIMSRVQSIVRKTGSGECYVCGSKTYYRCAGSDNAWLCMTKPGKKKEIDIGCALKYHSDDFFGLAKNDHKDVHGKTTNDWRPPTRREMMSNSQRVDGLLKSMEDSAAAE